MTGLAWMAVAWTALALAIVPLLLTLLNLREFRTPEAADGRPHVTVLIPARNEEANIAAACAAVLASRDVEFELIVLDDASTDRTPSILTAMTDPRLRVAMRRRCLPAGPASSMPVTCWGDWRRIR